MKHETISFPNARGEQLAAVLHPVAQARSRAVVVAHGMLSSKDSPKHKAICKAAAELGWPALRFDFAGRGSSAGDPQLLTVSREIQDLVAAAGEMRQRGAKELAVVGSSLGGTVAVLAIAQGLGVERLVTIASPSRLASEARSSWGAHPLLADPERIVFDDGTIVFRELFRDAGLHEPTMAATRVSCPWLILHGEQDTVIPPSHARELAGATPSARLIVHPKADHRFASSGHQAWLVEQILSFLAVSP